MVLNLLPLSTMVTTLRRVWFHGAAWLVLLVAFAATVQAASHVLPGLEVRSVGPQDLHLTYRPAIERWDTTHVEQVPFTSSRCIQPVFRGARLHVSNDGRWRQWIVKADVIVPGPLGFSHSGDTLVYRPVAGDMAMCGASEQDLLLRSTMVPPQASPLELRYSGVARGRHLATLSIVVAQQREAEPLEILVHASTFIAMDPVSATLGPARVGPTPTVINPSAPWWAQRWAADAESQTQLRKQRARDEVQSEDDLTHVCRIDITEEGIYRFTAQQLRQAGLPTTAEAATTIKLFGNGGRELSEQVEPPRNDQMLEQPLIVTTTPSGEIEEITFYASGPTGFVWDSTGPKHYIHHYDTKASYLLTIGGSAGRRSVQRPAASGPADQSPLTVTGMVFSEEEVVNPYNGGSGRRWYGRTIENGGSMMVPFDLPGLVRTGTVQYRFIVAHRGTSASGMCTISDNGTTIAQRSIPAVPKYMDTYSVPMSGSMEASKIAPDGKSLIRLTYESTQRTSTGILDWAEVYYPRGLVAHQQEFSFFANPPAAGTVEYTINGFEGGSVLGFDVTDPARPEAVRNVAPSGSLFSLREAFASRQVRRYYISSKTKTASLQRLDLPTLRRKARSGDLGTMLIITHPGLKASAERYAQYRRQNSDLTVSVVTTEQIMNEFAYGVQDPTALRDYIGFVYRHSPTPPRYVLLWGDGHYDYKNISTATPNWVPPYESLDPDNISWGLWTYTTDDYFVRVDGNDARPDVAIGRLPITSNSVGDRMTQKIRAYEHGSSTDDWRTRVTLIADDGATSDGTDGSTHLRQSERLWSDYLPLSIQAKKIYLVEYPTENIARGRRKPSVTAEYVSTVNTSGSLLLNWIGHGNPRVWSHEFVFERETTPSLMNNADKLFFLTAATCDFARFDLTDVQSGAEELVLRDGGGAIGVFSAARVVLSDANAAINQDLYETLFTRDADGLIRRMGDVLWDVKQRFYGPNDEKFFLLGDPTVRLLVPDHRIVFERINGEPLTAETLQIKALSTVTVEGYITQPIGTDVDETFTGVATLTLQDALRTVTVIDDDIASTPNTFRLPGASLNRGSYPVTRGRFSATFVVPKDVAFSNSTARMYGYAASDDERTAIGGTDRLVVDGVVDATFDDTDGPDIQISLDSRYFRSGDVVRPNPILIVDFSDETGINTSGVGIGHGIEAMFNQDDRVEDLTGAFSTSVQNSRAGTSRKQIFGLSEGLHEVRVRAWDVLNNMSMATTSFRIADADEGIVATWVTNYPNPFSTSTTIRFQHNIDLPFTATVDIFDVTGRLVYQAPMDIRDMQTAEIQWDGVDNSGNQLGTGVFVAVVRMTDATGARRDVRGKLALIR